MVFHLGISSGFHDAALSLIDDSGNILFAAHNERYSKIKNDSNISNELIDNVLALCHGNFNLCYYEKPTNKILRKIKSGENWNWHQCFTKNFIPTRLLEYKPKINSYSHHLSHAAAGFQTSTFNKATILVIDAIGELDTISIYHASYDKHGKAIYKKVWQKKYPHSLGLFYTAMTQKVGLKPLEDEYILMGMAAYGKNTVYSDIVQELLADQKNLEFKKNLHRGLPREFLSDANLFDIACSSQTILEELLVNVLAKAKILANSDNLVYMGGVALNCLANRHIGKYFSNIWIMPNPGDAGSSLGAAALSYGKKCNWQNAYLGFDIVKPYPVQQCLTQLLENKIVGVANGKAEFGPRALGNRSLLADPRSLLIKDKLNSIKKRQEFRPFGPVILEEFVSDYFRLPVNWHSSPYMQVVADCLSPELFPAIVHADNTSRIQTVPPNKSGIRILLEQWYNSTGCPMLLNTSLNIKGEPMVNNQDDADRFQLTYGIPVY